MMGVAANSLLSLLDSLVLVMDGGGVYNRYITCGHIMGVAADSSTP
jgi:hypothetical protein